MSEASLSKEELLEEMQRTGLQKKLELVLQTMNKDQVQTVLDFAVGHMIKSGSYDKVKSKKTPISDKTKQTKKHNKDELDEELDDIEEEIQAQTKKGGGGAKKASSSSSKPPKKPKQTKQKGKKPTKVVEEAAVEEEEDDDDGPLRDPEEDEEEEYLKQQAASKGRNEYDDLPIKGMDNRNGARMLGFVNEDELLNRKDRDMFAMLDNDGGEGGAGSKPSAEEMAEFEAGGQPPKAGGGVDAPPPRKSLGERARVSKKEMERVNEMLADPMFTAKLERNEFSDADLELMTRFAEQEYGQGQTEQEDPYMENHRSVSRNKMKKRKPDPEEEPVEIDCKGDGKE